MRGLYYYGTPVGRLKVSWDACLQLGLPMLACPCSLSSIYARARCTCTCVSEYVCVCVYMHTRVLTQMLGPLLNKPLNHLKRKPLKGSSGKSLSIQIRIYLSLKSREDLFFSLKISIGEVCSLPLMYLIF